MPLLAEFGRWTSTRANAAMIGEYFARMDTAAALPGLRAIVEDWRPDVIVRECWEYASTLVAELHGIPVVRVALGLAAVEELSIGLAAAALDAARAELGLPPDPGRRPAPRHAVPHDDPGGARGPRRPGAAAHPSLPATAVRPTRRRWRLVARQRRSARLRDVRLGDGRRAPAVLPGALPGGDRRARAAARAACSSRSATAAIPRSWARCRPTSTSRSGSRRTRWRRTPRRSSATAGTGPRSARSPTACRRSSCRCSASTSGRTPPPSSAPARASRSTPSAQRRVLARPGPETMDALGPAVERVLAEPSHRREAQQHRRRDARAAARRRRGRRAGGDQPRPAARRAPAGSRARP